MVRSVTHQSMSHGRANQIRYDVIMRTYGNQCVNKFNFSSREEINFASFAKQLRYISTCLLKKKKKKKRYFIQALNIRKILFFSKHISLLFLPVLLPLYHSVVNIRAWSSASSHIINSTWFPLGRFLKDNHPGEISFILAENLCKFACQHNGVTFHSVNFALFVSLGLFLRDRRFLRRT